MENILRWVAGFVAVFKKPTEYFSRPRAPVSGIAAETHSEITTTTRIATAAVITAVNANTKIGQDGQVTRVTSIPPDQQEIQRRRELVRALFNDFWSGRDDKPTAFVDRLDQAENYLNERLAACGEFWQLDAKTREMLGLPSRSNSRNKGSGLTRPI